MLKEKIREWIESDYNGSLRFVKEKNFTNKLGKEAFNEVSNYAKWIDKPFSRKVFCYLNDISEQPICKIPGCNNPTKFNDTSNQYKQYCSNKCRYKGSNETTEKRRETNLKRYGSTNVLTSKKVVENTKKKMLEKHGVENYFQSEEYKNRPKVVDRKIKLLDNTYNRLLSYGTSDNSKPVFNRDEFKGQGYENNYKWLCLDCNKEYISWYNGGMTKGCPHCKPRHTKPERDIINILESFNIDYNIGNRKIISPQELDFYIPSKNVAIEVDGLYWHCDLNVDKNYHLNKTELCEKRDIQLIHIFDDEIKYKHDIVKGRLKSIFNLNENKIYARDCKIEVITSKLGNSFFDNNHLQGRCNSLLYVALIHNNEIVMCISLSKLRKSLGHSHIDGHYELTRVASKLDYTIVGGFSRLFKFFINQYRPRRILSYCDRRWSTGTFYENIGMRKIKVTQPNYWYFHNAEQIRYHRFKFRKNILSEKLEIFDENLTEYENMKNNNYMRIWDCGSYLFEYIV